MLLRAAVLLCLVGTSHADVTPPAVAIEPSGCARLPSRWSIDEMATVIEPKTTGAKIRVLAWQEEVDDRPLYLNRAVVLVENKSSGFTLAHLYQHPRENSAWHVSVVYDVPYTGSRSYAARPTPKELDTFLDDTWWHFKADSGFRLLGSEVCDWRPAFGRPAWHHY